MRVSRRQVLRALWGAPLAAAATACRCERRVEGMLLGTRSDVGHRLRKEAPTWEQATERGERVRVAIVGAGPSGLSAAWKLMRAGERDVRVFDLEDAAGGTSVFGRRGELAYPWGAHYVPMPLPMNTDLIELLDEVGALESRDPVVGKEEFLARAPEERLFYEGRWFEGLYPQHDARAEDLAELSRFEREIGAAVDYRDESGRRAFTLPSIHCSDAKEVTRWDRMTAAEWLREKEFRSERLRWYVDYACRDDYGTTVEQTSAWAMLFYYASRRESSTSESQPFVTWPEGNGRLVQHMARRVGDHVRLGQLVTDVAPEAGSVHLAVLDVASGTLRHIQAEHVILATPTFIAARILRPWREQPPEGLQQLSYGAWLVANLHLKGRPQSNAPELGWDSVLYRGASLGYVDAGFQALHDRGRTTWTYYHPLTLGDPTEARDYLLNATYDDLAEGILRELSTAHPDLGEYLEQMDIWRWGHAMVRPLPGVIWGGSLRAHREPHPRVHIAHTDRSGFALFEEAQYWGIAAANQVLSVRG